MNDKVTDSFLEEYYWEGRIRSVRELVRKAHDSLNKFGYNHEYRQIKDERGAIDGTAFLAGL